MIDTIKKILTAKLENQQQLLDKKLLEQIHVVADKIIKALRTGNKILVCGNGGSAADAQHFVAELIGRFQKERRALPAIALHTNTSVLTAIANDYSYDYVFARQVEALGERGDVLLGISTSGESPSVIEAIKAAKKKNMVTIALTGSTRNSLTMNTKFYIQAPGNNTAEIQESHIIILHTICQLVEEEVMV